MVTIENFSQTALSFPETEQHPHFEKVSFRIKNKIFAILAVKQNEAVVKFSLIDQSVFCAIDRTIIYPVKGSWGKQGWTYINLKKINKGLIKDVLKTAYCEVAPKKLSGTLKKV
jgi:predicted DNA-binding protein (MmcQ/YjbR family)